MRQHDYFINTIKLFSEFEMLTFNVFVHKRQISNSPTQIIHIIYNIDFS